jgi:hypothetical protein
MHALVGEQLLAAWDRGSRESDLARALTLLTVSSPERTRESVAALSLAERDLELWRLRQMTFGEWLRATLPCRECPAQMEFTLDLSSVIEPLERLRLSAPVAPSERQVNGWRVNVEPATTRDLEAALRMPDQSSSKQTLLERCTSLVDPVGAAARWSEAPDAVRDCATEVFEEIHEGAEFTCAAACPQCGAVEMADLDIGRFLWFEVRNAAQRLLREVHELAYAYGWSESAILAMSFHRRQNYLAMVRT